MLSKNLRFVLIAVVAAGLIAVGCGGDDETTPTVDGGAVTDVTVPTDAEQALEDAPENVDEAVQDCLDNVENSDLPDDQKQNLKDLCEAGGNAAQDAIDNAQSLNP
jgi:hypothetical protein